MGIQSVLFWIVLGIVLLFLGLNSYNRYKIRKDEDVIKKYLQKIDIEKLHKMKKKGEKYYEPVFKHEEKEEPVEEIKEEIEKGEKPEIKDELSSKEKDILTLVHDVPKESAINRVKNFVDYSEKEINEILKRLEELELINIIKIPKGNLEEEEYYFRTTKVTDNMLNDLLRFEKDFGWDFGEV